MTTSLCPTYNGPKIPAAAHAVRTEASTSLPNTSRTKGGRWRIRRRNRAGRRLVSVMTKDHLAGKVFLIGKLSWNPARSRWISRCGTRSVANWVVRTPAPRIPGGHPCCCRPGVPTREGGPSASCWESECRRTRFRARRTCGRAPAPHDQKRGQTLAITTIQSPAGNRHRCDRRHVSQPDSCSEPLRRGGTPPRCRPVQASSPAQYARP